ncbi:MAG: glycosyltransferase [Clostridia bacterium]
MRFSILVPVYNTESYLKECLDSVFAQTEQTFELILINDGSIDRGGMICDRYRALHPDCVKVVHQMNAGLIAARRAAIGLARGEYCVFLDADDALEPDALATVRACIDKTHADIVIFNYLDRFEETATSVPAVPVFPDGSVFFGEEKRTVYGELIRSWRLNNLCTKAIRTALVTEDDTPYDPFLNNPNTEDLLQTLYPVTHAEIITYLAKPLYQYRRRNSSISAQALSGRIETQFNEQVMAQLRRYMTLWAMDAPQWLTAFHTRKIFGLITLFWQHYRAAETDEEKRAVMEYPWQQRLTDEDKRYLHGNTLSLSKRVQLNAILKKRKFALDLFETIGTLRMRVRHGE